MSDEKIETYDEVRGVGILSGRPPTEPQGPLRRAPEFYAGKTFGKKRKGKAKGQERSILHADVERHPNGAVVGTRNKAARRLVRGALKRRYSKASRDLKLPQAMQVQAREIINEQPEHADKTPRAKARLAKRLFEAELAIHTPRPNEPTRAERREYARQLKKAGKKDAISQLVDMMAAKKP